MTASNNKIKTHWTIAFLREVKDSFIAGYKSGLNKAKEAEKAKIVTVTPAQTEDILNQMNKFENEMLQLRIKFLEDEIKLLSLKINQFIISENQKQEMIVHLMTIVEEMLHSLEEAGIIPPNELELSKTSSEDEQMNDVMKPIKQFDSQNITPSSTKKFDLN